MLSSLTCDVVCSAIDFKAYKIGLVPDKIRLVSDIPGAGGIISAPTGIVNDFRRS